MVNFSRKQKSKIFGRKSGRPGDDGSVVSTRSGGSKFFGVSGRGPTSPMAESIPEESPVSAPAVAAPAPAAPQAEEPAVAAPPAEAVPVISSPPMSPAASKPPKSKSKSVKSLKSGKSKSPLLAKASPPPDERVEERQEEVEEEAREEPPANFPDEPVQAAASASVAEASVSGASVEQSFEESVAPSMEEVSQVYGNESETVETYDEDLSQGTSDDKSYEEECTYDEGTKATNEEGSTLSAARSTNTVKGNDMTKKYFHKDVVLNSLEDGANSLVIRAMYFIPKPKADDHVVVKIEASTISARDCMKCRGHGLTAAMLPFVPGFEVVGTIQAVGNEARKEGQFREGDRVAGISTFGGGNSRFISIPSTRLTKISNNVKSTLAVCMIHDYMAALKALRLAKKHGSPFTGMNILVTDGFSPVGQAVIALASMEGANIYCCADEAKHSYLASLGAKCFVKNPDSWLPTATGTFDVVIDNSCVDSYSSSWFALNQKGSLVCLAPVFNIEEDDIGSGTCGLNINQMQQNWAAMKARYMMTQTSFLNTVTCYDDDTEQYKQDLRYLMFLLERGDIKPKVAERVSLDDVPDAQRLMQSGRANGTVVCVPWIEE